MNENSELYVAMMKVIFQECIDTSKDARENRNFEAANVALDLAQTTAVHTRTLEESIRVQQQGKTAGFAGPGRGRAIPGNLDD